MGTCSDHGHVYGISMNTNVRAAKPEDKLNCIRLLRESHEAAGFTFPFSAVHASALFDLHYSSPQACILVMGDKPQGLLMASWFEHPFGAGRYAKETVWYVTQAARGRGAIKMLDAYEAWAKEQGCAAIGMASLISNDVSKLYERRGYAAAETHFVKSIS